jgi:hypothetical protein
MKHILLSISMLIIFILGSCQDHSETVDHETTIEIITPTINQNFKLGEKVLINALISSNVSMHGYEVVLKSNGQTTSLKSKHTHNKVFEVNAEWIVDIANTVDATIEVIANIDHKNTKQTKSIAVKIN